MQEKFATLLLGLFALFCLLVACTINEPTFEPGAGAEATATPGATAAELPPATATLPSTPFPTATPWDGSPDEISLTATSAMATAHPDLVPAPGEIFTPTPVPPFPDIVYRTETGLWRVGSDGQPKHLTSFANAVLSPDGTQVVYADQGDLWLTQLSTGTTRQLTTTPTHLEHSPQWWPVHPDIILFQFDTVSSQSDTENRGYQAILDVNEGIIWQEQEEPAYGGFAAAPNGQTLLYDRRGVPFVYDWDTATSSAFDVWEYKLPDEIFISRFISPTWTSDGQKIAWLVDVQPVGRASPLSAILVLDTISQTGYTLHSFEEVAIDRRFAAAAWSPDNQWLAFVAEDVDPARAGVWVVKTDGSEEHYLGPGSLPVWSPDGQWLTYQGVTPQLVATTSWYTLNLFVYENGTVIDWR